MTIGGSYIQGGIVAFLRLLSVCIGLVYVKYYTNAVSLEQIGEFFYLGALSYFLNALIFVPIDGYMQARVSRLGDLPYQPIKILVYITLLVALMICTILSIPLVFMELLQLADVPLLYAMAALLYLCTSARNLLNIRGHSTFAAGMVLFESAARLLAFVAVAAALGATARAMLVSSIVALAVEFVILLWQIRNKLPLSTSSESLDAPTQILRTASSLAGGAVSNTVQLQAYRVVFPAAGHPDTAAVLGVTANIGAVAMSSCAQVYSQIFLPKLYNTQGASIGQYVNRGTAIAIALLILGLLLSDTLILYITKVDYVPYAYCVGFGIVIEACNMLIGAYSICLTLGGRTGVIFGAQFVGALVSLAGCLALVKQFPGSPLMVGLVLTCSQLLVTIALGLYVRKIQKN